MNFKIFLNNNVLKTNPTIDKFLNQYDKEGNYSDGKFSRKEVFEIVNKNVSRLGIFLLGKNKITNIIMDEFDRGKTKDGFITIEEINNYLNEEYGLKYKDIQNLTITKTCDLLEKSNPPKKNSK